MRTTPRSQAIAALKAKGFGGIAAATIVETLYNHPDLLADLAIDAGAFERTTEAPGPDSSLPESPLFRRQTS